MSKSQCMAEPALSPIPDDTPYVVVDCHTGLVVYRTTYKNRKRAWRYADRRDTAYGAVRFSARIESAVHQ